MNKLLNTIYRKLAMTTLLLLLVTVCFAQDNVRLLNGSAFISEGAAGAADGRLATELPNHDVRISYVTSFVGVQDRYKIYQSNDLIPFSQLPYEGGFAPATQAQKDTAVNAGIHHAITTLPAPSQSTIHIIYAVSVSLDEQGDEAFSSRKFFQFGSNVDRRSEKIVEQIVPNPELEAAGDVSRNDIYLADYVEELIDALNDPNYVVNGTIEYNGESYWDGDTIFYFHSVDELIATEVAGLKELNLLVNPGYPVTPVFWNETQEIAGAGTLIANTSGGTANLKIKAQHFVGISKLTGTYGNEITTVWYYPVNLRLELSNYDEVETHTLAPIDVTLTNNGYDFSAHPSLRLQISGYTYGALGNIGATVFRQSYPPGNAPNFQWNWTQEVCKTLRYIGSVHRPNIGYMEERLFDMRVKCPFGLAGLKVMSYNSETGTLNPNRVAYGGMEGQYPGGRNDTLFIVSNDNDLSRQIKYEPIWEGSPPGNDDYWGPNGNAGGVGVEPIWYFGSPDLSIYDVDPTPENSYHQASEFEVMYHSSAFPGTWIFNPGIGTVDVNAYTAGIRAFRNFEGGQIVSEEHQKVNIAFIRDSRFDRSRDLGSAALILQNPGELLEAPLAFQFITVIVAAKNDIGSFMESVGLDNTLVGDFLDQFEPGTSIEESYFQIEDDNSRNYLNVVEKAYKVSLNKGFGPYPIGSLGIDLWIGRLGLFWSAEFGLYYLQEKASQKLYYNSEYEQTELTDEYGFNGSISLQGGFTTNEEYEGMFQVTALGQLTASVELKCKDNYNASGYENTTNELHIQPLVFDINLVLTLGEQESNYNWTVVNETFSFHLSDKMEFPFATHINGCFGSL